MATTETVIRGAYAAFNRRDIDAALELMSESVDWPKASEGGRVIGKDAIREYWTRQWAEFDPHVEPVKIADAGDGTTDVQVHQVVKSLQGDVLSDMVVLHVHTVVDGLIERMEVGGGEGAFGQR